MYIYAYYTCMYEYTYMSCPLASSRTCGYLFQFSQFTFKTKTKSPAGRDRHVGAHAQQQKQKQKQQQQLPPVSRKLCTSVPEWMRAERGLVGWSAEGGGLECKAILGLTL